MQSSPAKSSLAHFSPHLQPPVDGPIKVRAIMRGFYGNALRHPGAVFGIYSEDELGPWMERLSDDEARELEHAQEPESEPDPETTFAPRAPTPKRSSKPAKRKPAPAAKPKPSDDDVL